jgi:hypothetical protein
MGAAGMADPRDGRPCMLARGLVVSRDASGLILLTAQRPVATAT